MLLVLSAIGLPFIPGWYELRPFAADLSLIVTIVAVLLGAGAAFYGLYAQLTARDRRDELRRKGGR